MLIVRDKEIAISPDLVLSWDLARFHKCEVLSLFPLRFRAFWQKNGVNRNNIKEDRAILRFSRWLPYFGHLASDFFKIHRRWDIDLEGFHEIDLRSLECFQRDNKIAISRDLARSREISQIWGPTFFPLRFWAFWRKNRANRTNIKEDRAICLSWSHVLTRIHKPEILRFFPLRFWAFWRKNEANRTNIKEDRAI